MSWHSLLASITIHFVKLSNQQLLACLEFCLYHSLPNACAAHSKTSETNALFVSSYKCNSKYNVFSLAKQYQLYMEAYPRALLLYSAMVAALGCHTAG